MKQRAGRQRLVATAPGVGEVGPGPLQQGFGLVGSLSLQGEGGADQLLGHGDMLLSAGGSQIRRVHGAFVDDNEIDAVASFLKSQGEPVYVETLMRDKVSVSADGGAVKTEVEDDPLYADAVALVQDQTKVTISFIQRVLKIGRTRAGRLAALM